MIDWINILDPFLQLFWKYAEYVVWWSNNKQKNPNDYNADPWIIFWTATSFDSRIGAMIVLLVTALMPLIMRNVKFTIWDRISFALVGVLSVGIFMGGNGGFNLIVDLGILAFGLMWLVSCIIKDPLCAAYVKYGYGGDIAYNNPLFMKTNYFGCMLGCYVRINCNLELACSSKWSRQYFDCCKQLVPICMGLFTAWFQKWYPAKMASGK